MRHKQRIEAKPHPSIHASLHFALLRMLSAPCPQIETHPQQHQQPGQHWQYRRLCSDPYPQPDLLAAAALLAQMPTDTIPPGMPLYGNNFLVGRQANLHQLANTLKGGTTMAIGQIAATTGLRGIGKTQFASEFVHRYGPYFAGGTPVFTGSALRKRQTPLLMRPPGWNSKPRSSECWPIEE